MQFFFTRYATVKERSTLAASDEWSGGKQKLYQAGRQMSMVGRVFFQPLGTLKTESTG